LQENKEDGLTILTPNGALSQLSEDTKTLDKYIEEIR
jgi:hypothetical protein